GARRGHGEAGRRARYQAGQGTADRARDRPRNLEFSCQTMVTKTKKFEDELKDLETIVNQIDSGELTLEESIGAFERGVMLVKALNGKLDEVERKVELLTRSAGGELRTAPFEASSDDEHPAGARDDDETSC